MVYGNVAKDYRKLGWRGTLPLPPRQKEAPPDGFTGHGAPYPSDMQVRQWAKAQPNGNICLRLADVDNAWLRADLPVIYGGNNVDGWELIGIDVDDYGEKHGAAQLAAMEAELGELPATVVSSARWLDAPLSGTRLYLVPKGFRYKGKAYASNHDGAKHIDVLYAGLRYLVVWPSLHPKAGLYEFRYGRPGSETALTEYAAVPPLTDVEVLPLAWFMHLLSDNAAGVDAKSDLNYGELTDWADKTFHDGPPCRLMLNDLNKYKAELDESDQHTPLTNVVWRFTLNAIEGHAGWAEVMDQYISYWWDVSQSKRDLDEMRGEIGRNVAGALAKAKAKFDERGGFMPDDTCAGTGDAKAWQDKFEADQSKIADADYGGLGPVVGPMEALEGKPADEYEMNDRGNGQHFIGIYGDDVKYVDSRRAWILWDGTRWNRDFEDKLIGLAYSRVETRQRNFARSIPRGDKEGIAKSKAWYSHALKSGNIPTIKNAIKAACGMYAVSGKRVALSGSEFDANPTLLGCENGILMLNDNPDVRPPVKEDYVTYNTHVPYIPWRSLANAEGEAFEGYELWIEYLNKFLPDKKIQRFVQKVMGHLLVGGNPEKLIVFLWGPHDTGKSTMICALKGALGDYYGTIDMKLFREQDKNPALVRAVPLRVTAMSEADAGVMDGPKIKQLTGNDPVTAELKYSNEIFEGTPQFTTLIATNNPPNIRHSDEALEERLLCLPFINEMPRRDRLYERQVEIQQHSGVAVLSWLVEGWKMYREELLKRDGWPLEIKRHNRDFSAGLNNTQEFIRECLARAKDSEAGRREMQRALDKAKANKRWAASVADYPLEWTASAAAVYDRYLRWCRTNGVNQPDTALALSKDIGLGKAHVRKIGNKPTKCYVGLRIKDNGEEVRIGGGKLK